MAENFQSWEENYYVNSYLPVCILNLKLYGIVFWNKCRL